MWPRSIGEYELPGTNRIALCQESPQISLIWTGQYQGGGVEVRWKRFDRQTCWQCPLLASHVLVEDAIRPRCSERCHSGIGPFSFPQLFPFLFLLEPPTHTHPTPRQTPWMENPWAWKLKEPFPSLTGPWGHIILPHCSFFSFSIIWGKGLFF